MANIALKLGDSGAQVVQLQKRLADAGFSPGTQDGEFGVATRAAEMAFQKINGPLADRVAGPRTLGAQGLATMKVLPDAKPLFTVQVVARMFIGTKLGNIRTNLPPVLAALLAAGLHDRVMVLAALATVRAETAPFLPLTERPVHFQHVSLGPRLRPL